MEYRELREDDHIEWKRIRLESLLDSPPAFGVSFEEESVKDEGYFKNTLINNKVFGAFQDNRLVSCVGLLFTTGDRYKHRGKIFGVYTTPSARGKGACKRLMQMAIDYAKGKVLWLQLNVWTENPAAMKLYSSFGFVQYCLELKSLRVNDNEYVDYYIMRLDLE